VKKKISATLQLKVAGRPPIEVYTSFPVTLKRKSDGKMVAYANENECEVIQEYSKKRIIEAWHNSTQKATYEVVWSGDCAKGLTKSKLPDQKGLLMGDYAGGSATKQIMDHCMMADIDDDLEDKVRG
jgi:hypothetical protein